MEPLTGLLRSTVRELGFDYSISGAFGNLVK